MTLSELLACDADTLEKMTDAQLLEHFKPYLEVTRPEQARKAKPKINEPAPFISPGKKKAFAALEALGLDTGDLIKKGKK